MVENSSGLAMEPCVSSEVYKAIRPSALIIRGFWLKRIIYTSGMHPKEREKQHEQDCGGARLLLHEDEEKHKAIQYMTRHVKRHIMKRHMKRRTETRRDRKRSGRPTLAACRASYCRASRDIWRETWRDTETPSPAVAPASTPTFFVSKREHLQLNPLWGMNGI